MGQDLYSKHHGPSLPSASCSLERQCWNPVVLIYEQMHIIMARAMIMAETKLVSNHVLWITVLHRISI